MRSIPTAQFAAFTSLVRVHSKVTQKAAFLLISLAALLVGGATVGRGQSALDGFDPNANDEIKAIVVQPDGKILIGGDFTTLAPNGGAVVTRNKIARLNSDGTLDTAFDPNASADVISIAIQANGKILVGGQFTTIGGQPRNRIARLDPITGLADSFNPNANGEVRDLLVQPDGKILTAGIFTTIGGQPRGRFARLDATTGLADSFNPNPDSTVNTLALQADGRVLAGGDFTTIGGQPRNRIARLDATTGLADSFNPNAKATVDSIALQADGKILVAGNFFGANSIGGQTRSFIVRLDPTTGLPDSFDPQADGRVWSIVVQADGKILVAGQFAGIDSIGGAARNRMARLDPVTGLADSFDPNPSSGIVPIALQPDGKILVGGEFTTLAPSGGAPVTRNFIARLETDGRLDRTLNLNMVGRYVRAIAVQTDGKILVGGYFHNILGVSRGNIARLNTDGTLDMAFNPDANDDANDNDGEVNAIAVQADGKILVGGALKNIGGQTRNHIARLDATGATDMSFNPNANGSVRSIAVQADGKIIASGDFTNIGGQPRNRIARLDAITGSADSFNPNPSDTVRAIVVQADGKVLVGGDFSNIGGEPRNRIARLDAITGLADSFNPNPNSPVYTIVVQADGKILAGGVFGIIGGQTRGFIARLDANTGLADSFNPNANAPVFVIAIQADGKILAGGNFITIGGQPRNRIARLDAITGMADSFNPDSNTLIDSIAVQTDGKILVGGNFLLTSIGGQPREFFARLSNDTAALQNLAVTQTCIIWTRGARNSHALRLSPQMTM